MGKYVRYLHGSPDIGIVNILDGEIPIIRDLHFGMFTSYLFADEPERFQIEEESSLVPWRVMRQDAEPMTTWVINGEAGKPMMVPVEDPMLPASGQAALRLANFAKETVDLYIGQFAEKQEELFSGVEPGEVTEYQQIEPGQYFMDIRPAGEPDTVLLRMPSMRLRRNVLYTLYIIGNEDRWKTLLTVDGASYLPHVQSGEGKKTN